MRLPLQILTAQPLYSASGTAARQSRKYIAHIYIFSCKTRAEQLHENGRVKFWDRLPDAFGLPGWDELAKEREVPA
ncbi:hypothetical protein FIBSPDRAFT_192028 [Athelia psychrophila]|uniref:Uncharacterized protein n=1 Tax=Athelia psychrophila TaxID=1759441 RepID=A0A166A0P0_9AGAM|nr:hypothetical protein FIBSPDRAFT_192028 [Fibularhizoctonia sp. CBS 109695]